MKPKYIPITIFENPEAVLALTWDKKQFTYSEDCI